ncbi:hypothetical protein RvY_04906 [Ramazzottius varieornatus]|uniref:D domain-containing protein n=1 Tax=Ramazzottius varieornatus TaxID=947166 RepID=A0A1D1V2D1_RAMVA|nr:hypothetical protein RvY_04906 [Ramazzottius varieornatus]
MDQNDGLRNDRSSADRSFAREISYPRISKEGSSSNFSTFGSGDENSNEAILNSKEEAMDTSEEPFSPGLTGRELPSAERMVAMMHLSETAPSPTKDITRRLSQLGGGDTARFPGDFADIFLRFDHLGEEQQIQFAQELLLRMNQFQHGEINSYLKPLLKRDFISLLSNLGLHVLAEKILFKLDASSLRAAERVCHDWSRVVAEGQLWRKLIENNVRTDPLWRGIGTRRGWIRNLFRKYPLPQLGDTYYRQLYPIITRDIDTTERNWKLGNFALHKINCRSENSKGVYCLQYDDEKIISGLRDNTIKVWDRNNLQCSQILTGHTGSVLCLQYDERIIVSGSSDSTVRVWDIARGEMLNTLVHHCEAVLHVRFQNGMMVTCSKDRSIAVWDMLSPKDIALRRVLVGHRAAVNVVDFDDKYIVSASGDRTIKVWSTSSCEFVRTLQGHKRGIACLQYKERLIASGSSDNTIRLWDIECGACLRVLEGHEELVRCIRFDNKRIVSGAYDGKIKIWDLQAALNPLSLASSLCVKTLVEHTGRVFRLQFDEFQIVSSSHDDTILIWDFFNNSVVTLPQSAASGRSSTRIDGDNQPMALLAEPLAR